MFLVGEKIKRRYHFKHQRPLLTVIFSSSAAACCLTRNMPTSSRGHCCQKQASRSLWGFTWWPLFPSNLHWKVESFALRSLSASIFTAPDFASALLFQRAHLFPAPHCNSHQERRCKYTVYHLTNVTRWIKRSCNCAKFPRKIHFSWDSNLKRLE